MSKSDLRPPTSHITPFGLRMQPELKEQLEQAARVAGRSLNAEIVARLQASFEEQSKLPESGAKKPEIRQMVIEEMENFITGEKMKAALENMAKILDIEIIRDGNVTIIDHKLPKSLSNKVASTTGPERRIRRKVTSKPE